METKSRYEVISELEKQKRDLIQQKANIKDVVAVKEKEIKTIKRMLEYKEAELVEYKATLKEKEDVVVELIKSVETTLERFQAQQKS
jgi:hypothetical protein